MAKVIKQVFLLLVLSSLAYFALTLFHFHPFTVLKIRVVRGSSKKQCMQNMGRELVEKNLSQKSIQLVVANSIGKDAAMCLKPRTPRKNSQFITQTCDVEDESQLLWVDRGGQIHLSNDKSLCLSKMRSGKSIQLQSCQADDQSMLILKQSQGKESNIFNILWKGNTDFGLSSNADGSKVFLARRSDQRHLQDFMPIAMSHMITDRAYIPGFLSLKENGLILSKGLKSRIIAKSKKVVTFANGETSSTKFHERPDGAAVFRVQMGSNRGG